MENKAERRLKFKCTPCEDKSGPYYFNSLNLKIASPVSTVANDRVKIEATEAVHLSDYSMSESGS